MNDSITIRHSRPTRDLLALLELRARQEDAA